MTITRIIVFAWLTDTRLKYNFPQILDAKALSVMTRIWKEKSHSAGHVMIFLDGFLTLEVFYQWK